ncbi:MAG TPA: thioredoxin domain-containing protein [Gemmatimonadales bacterium]|nr:thioredoxin domain-containing protein [Gemmatimonadales bacterium]
MANRYGALLLGALTAAAVAGCSDRNASAATADRARGPSTPAADEAIPDTLASIGSEKVTMADVRSRVGTELDQMETRYRISRHALVEKTLRQLLQERVVLEEARKQGKSLEEMVVAEAGGAEPSEVEIAAWYQENQSRVSGRTLDQIRPQIAELLRKERRVAALEAIEARMNRERNVTVHLQPLRLDVDDPAAPALGPANAPVTLVEFSDFQCPFCGRFYPTLHRLAGTYGDKLRIVYRQYPIASLHPNAVKAAEASLCANEEGKFWEAHDLMFQEQDRLTVRELKAMAGRLGIDRGKFDTCLDSGRYTEQVQNDLADGARFGVTGTPALFVNGIPIDGGAVPYETVVRAIDAELARAN